MNNINNINNNSIKIKEIISENNIVIYNDNSLDLRKDEFKLDNMDNFDDNIKSEKFNVNINEDKDIKCIKYNVNENISSFVDFIKCKNKKKCKIFGCLSCLSCLKCWKHTYNTKLYKFFNNKKLFKKEGDLIISSLKKQLYHNLYELKKELFL